MSDRKDPSESKVEIAKRGSRHLRGTIREVLESDATHFEHDDLQALKFHGVYQQDDRDVRRQRRAEGADRDYIFMVRVAIPGGVLTADQYLRLDALADTYGFGSLRVTTRQGLQFHRVAREDLKPLIGQINDDLITTLSASGDVERNVMGCPAPLEDEAHVRLRQVTRQIAEQLRPKSPAYHEIWLNGDRQLTGDDEEPFYGERYLPRKFKSGIALDSDNCVDIYSHDAGLIALIDEGRLIGFNVVVGGGMGMTHNKPDTFAALAQELGFVPPDRAVETVRTIAAVFRDHGNRADRRHARLKYLLDDWGLDRFRDQFRRRVDFEPADFRALPPIPAHDHLGLHPQGNGRFFYGVFVENGRVVDREDRLLKTALRAVVERCRPGMVLTPHQNILLTGLSRRDHAEIERTLGDLGVVPVDRLSGVRRYSMACPALPTCGLAVSESERLLPSVTDRLEAELECLGLRDEPLTVRMTGCPNGCARPYTADVAFVGKGPDNYSIYVGGRMEGDRVVNLYAADVKSDDFLDVLRPLLASWSSRRRPGEGLGDFYQRLLDRDEPQRTITGAERPTRETIALRIIQ